MWAQPPCARIKNSPRRNSARRHYLGWDQWNGLPRIMCWGLKTGWCIIKRVINIRGSSCREMVSAALQEAQLDLIWIWYIQSDLYWERVLGQVITVNTASGRKWMEGQVLICNEIWGYIFRDIFLTILWPFLASFNWGSPHAFSVFSAHREVSLSLCYRQGNHASQTLLKVPQKTAAGSAMEARSPIL